MGRLIAIVIMRNSFPNDTIPKSYKLFPVVFFMPCWVSLYSQLSSYLHQLLLG
jgi:hypothetical protein